MNKMEEGIDLAPEGNTTTVNVTINMPINVMLFCPWMWWAIPFMTPPK